MVYRDSADPAPLLRAKLLAAIEEAEEHVTALRKAVENPVVNPEYNESFRNEMEQRRAALQEAFRHKEALLVQLREAGL